MASAVPVWLAVLEKLLQQEDPDFEPPSCFDDFDDEALFETFHLTRPCIAFIMDAVRIRLTKYALKRPLRSVDAMVMVALDFYAQGASSAAILRKVEVNQTVWPKSIVRTVSGVIAGMSDQFISFPLSFDARVNVALKTEKLCGIPNVLGVLAPAHFKIRSVQDTPYEEMFIPFVNSQGHTSVVSQVICDSDGNILSVEKCCVGSTSEQEMWDTSFKGREMEEDLHGPFWVIGGKGYHLSKHVLTPVSDPANDKEIRFNEAHAKIHDVMQTTLDSMKRRFRCLMELGFVQEGSLNKTSNIIKACSVLHNIAKKFSVPLPPAADNIEPLHPGKQLSVAADINPEALKARKAVIDANFSVVSSERDTQGDNTTEEDVQAD